MRKCSRWVSTSGQELSFRVRISGWRPVRAKLHETEKLRPQVPIVIMRRRFRMVPLRASLLAGGNVRLRDASLHGRDNFQQFDRRQAINVDHGRASIGNFRRCEVEHLAQLWARLYPPKRAQFDFAQHVVIDQHTS